MLLRPVLLLLGVLVPLALLASEVRTEEQAGGLDPKVERKLRSKLRSRASTWWSHRKRLVGVCPQCKGHGKVRWRQGRRIALVECPKCDGHKAHVDQDDYRYCYYEARSPAFRLQEGIRARVSQEYVQAKAGSPFPQFVKKYSIKDMEIVDETHGVVWVKVNKDSVARPQKWVWAAERGKSASWWFYDPEADGPWPSKERAPPPDDPDVVVPEPPRQAPSPEAEPEAQPAPPPETQRPPPSPDREDFKVSKDLVLKWTDDRNEITARIIRIRLGLEKLEGYKEKVAQATIFLCEVEAWIEDSKEAYERATQEVEDDELGIRFSDRVKVNTAHIKCNRRLELVEDMFRWIIPELKDE